MVKIKPEILKRIIDYSYEQIYLQERGEITKDTVVNRVAEFIKEELEKDAN